MSVWQSKPPSSSSIRFLEDCLAVLKHIPISHFFSIDWQLNRTAELARVFGIDFFSVFSRGSQYRVESMMLRLAHTQNFVLISPNKQQVWFIHLFSTKIQDL
jgi:DNA polymerase zeta